MTTYTEEELKSLINGVTLDILTAVKYGNQPDQAPFYYIYSEDTQPVLTGSEESIESDVVYQGYTDEEPEAVYRKDESGLWHMEE